MSISKRKRHTKFPKRSTRRLLAAAFITLTAASVKAQNDLWLNPNGGNWSNTSNWSLGVLPVHGMYAYQMSTAQFSLGAATPYTVNLDSTPWDIAVQNDDVIINFNGKSYGGFDDLDTTGTALTVASTTGQLSSLTLQNGSLTSPSTFPFPQTGGTASLTLDSFKLYQSDSSTFPGDHGGPIAIGGTAGSVFNYTQIGGDLGTYWEPIEFGNGIGTVNVLLSGLTVHTDTEGEILFNANATLQNTTLTTSYDFISFSGSANVSGGFIDPGSLLLIGATVVYNPIHPPPEPTNIPTTGGANATFNASGAVINAAEALLVGTSGATATFTAAGSTIESYADTTDNQTSLWVGISGIGTVHLSGGTTLITDQAHIGYNGGTGTVTLSGVGTAWNSSGAPTNNGETAIDAAIDLGNGTIELDHGATLTLSAAQYDSYYPFIGGLLNISGGTLSVLSGARVTAVAMNESAGSTLQIGLDSPSASDNGQIIINGNAIFAGTLDVTLENGFLPTPGEAFQLFSFGSETGQFSTIDLPPDTSWDLSQLYTSGIITVTAVPEPGVAMLSILLSTGMLRRRHGRGSGL